MKESDKQFFSILTDAEKAIEQHSQKETINHPPHYRHPSGIECIEVVRHENFNRGNAIKYIWRSGVKDPDKEIEDLEKAIFYLKDEIERLKKEKNERKTD